MKKKVCELTAAEYFKYLVQIQSACQNAEIELEDPKPERVVVQLSHKSRFIDLQPGHIGMYLVNTPYGVILKAVNRDNHTKNVITFNNNGTQFRHCEVSNLGFETTNDIVQKISLRS